MNIGGIGSMSWLNNFDPANASSLTSLLDSSHADPSTSDTPAGFDVLAPTSSPSSSKGSNSSSTSGSPGLSQYQQALDALTETSDTFLIQSALGQTATASSSDSLSSALEAAEQEQASAQSVDTTA